MQYTHVLYIHQKATLVPWTPETVEAMIQHFDPRKRETESFIEMERRTA